MRDAVCFDLFVFETRYNYVFIVKLQRLFMRIVNHRKYGSWSGYIFLKFVSELFV